jgi:pyruvate-formate lyase-activating enzyme
MSLLKSKTFCVLPWIEKFQHLDGLNYLCCRSHVPIKPNEIDSIRVKIQNEQPVPHCESCYKLDQQRVVSPRLQESSRWLKDSQVKNFIEQWKPGDPESTFFYDLRFDNKCNLACIGCNPEESSLWARELGIKIKPQSIRFATEDMVKSKKIYMAGGEPLIINRFIELLDFISKQDQQPEIVINTNLTRINSDLQKILEQIKNLTLVISVDAVGSVNEYHRWPMKWNKFIDNLSRVRNLGCTLQFNTVIDSISIMNAADLVDIEGYCDLWNLSILKNPISLQVNNLPELSKLQIKNQWNKIKTSKFFKSDPTFKSRVNHVTNLIDQPGNYGLLRDYIMELDKRRNIRHQDFLPIELA